jgi:putative Holliday junction resolvase
MAKNKSINTVLGFDFGLRRIGVAVAKTMLDTATALDTLSAQNGAPDWEHIQQLIQQWQADAFIVGVPYAMSGEEHDLTRRARKFGNQLHGRFGLPVFWVDERLTSAEAERMLSPPMRRDPKQKGEIDKLAAKIILETWLENNNEDLK